MRRILILVALLAGGCAAPPATVSEEFPPTRQVESLTLPFDAYTPSLAALYTIGNAEDRLTFDCMKAAGLDWKMIVRPTTMKDLRNRRRYGVIEIPIASKYGYHVPAGLLSPISVLRLYDARDAGLDQHRKDAAYGTQGCAAKAARQLEPQTGTTTDRLTQFDRASLRDSRRDPRVATALTAWRTCMTHQGHPYRDPLAAISDPRWWSDDAPGSSPTAGSAAAEVPAAADGRSPAELATAVADVRCKDQSGLVDAWHAAETPIQQATIRRNAAYFERLAADLKRELTGADAVLARPPA